MERHPHGGTPLPEFDAPAGDAMTPRGILALRTALQATARGDASDGERVSRAVALFCAEAKRREMHVERVLVVVKEVWRTLPEARRLGRAQRELALAHLTSLTIRTFYGSEPPRVEGTRGDGPPPPPR